jgi:predicted GNAT superfamily acetyltransferase
MQPTPALPEHFAQILALNEASVHFLSPLSAARLAVLHQHAAYHRVITDQNEVQAFLLAFAPGAPYDSINYQWFDRREKDFLYIDRIVVASGARARGLGTLLYRDLFQMASALGLRQVVCEFDIDPPNRVSEVFHLRFGFREVGRQRVANGTKEVSLQSAAVPRPGSPAISRS